MKVEIEYTDGAKVQIDYPDEEEIQSLTDFHNAMMNCFFPNGIPMEG